MKKVMFINKAMSNLSHVTVIAMVWLSLTCSFATQANGQTTLKRLLAGTSSKTWELSEVRASGKSFKNIDFDEDDTFALKSDLAQLIPFSIEFNADGTCENTYVSQYENGEISDDDYTAPCEWSVKGNNVEIIENADDEAEIDEAEDEVITLIGVTVKGNELRSKFSIAGSYTGGVESLVFRNN
jgi:hypothetical protein